jgi:hypothetical protein
MPPANDLRSDSPLYFTLLEDRHAAALKETYKAAITSARWFRTLLIGYNGSLFSMGLCNNREERPSGRLYASSPKVSPVQPLRRMKCGSIAGGFRWLAYWLHPDRQSAHPAVCVCPAPERRSGNVVSCRIPSQYVAVRTEPSRSWTRPNRLKCSSALRNLLEQAEREINR